MTPWMELSLVTMLDVVASAEEPSSFAQRGMGTTLPKHKDMAKLCLRCCTGSWSLVEKALIRTWQGLDDLGSDLRQHESVLCQGMAGLPQICRQAAVLVVSKGGE